MSDTDDTTRSEDGTSRRFVRPWEQAAVTELGTGEPTAEEPRLPIDEDEDEDEGTTVIVAPDADTDAVAEEASEAEAEAEADADAVAEAVADADSDADSDADDAGAWLAELEDIGSDDEPGALTGEAYAAATTREYQDLAADIARARDEELEQQAVAATPAGVGSGLIGFDDVTGRPGLREEDVEHLEQARASDLTLRVVSAVILVGLLLVSLTLGGIWLVSFVTVVAVVALAEFYATLRSRGHTPVALFGLLSGLLAVFAGYSGGAEAVGGLLAGAVIATVLFLSLVRRADPLQDGALTILGAVWVAGLLGLAGPIIAAERGRALILLVVVLVAVLDMGGYFVGKAFGRRPLAPVLSPNKTVEGLVGGIVAAFAVAAIASTLPVFDPVDLSGALLLAGVVSVAAPIGDSAESLIKRLLDVKDMGSVLPGHGGMLDRIDGILFAVPVAYLVFDLLGYL